VGGRPRSSQLAERQILECLRWEWKLPIIAIVNDVQLAHQLRLPMREHVRASAPAHRRFRRLPEGGDTAND
jgi:hypothetical protein